MRNVCVELLVNKFGVRVKPFGLVAAFFVSWTKLFDVIGLYLVKCVCRPGIAEQIIEVGTPIPIRTVAIGWDLSIDKRHYLKW